MLALISFQHITNIFCQVISEALAGTRVRGSTSKEDEELFRDLMYSEKDRSENMITGNFIKDCFNELKDEGLLVNGKSSPHNSTSNDEIFFIRRLRHLQHICQSFEGEMKDKDVSVGKIVSLKMTLTCCIFNGNN